MNINTMHDIREYLEQRLDVTVDEKNAIVDLMFKQYITGKANPNER